MNQCGVLDCTTNLIGIGCGIMWIGKMSVVCLYTWVNWIQHTKYLIVLVHEFAWFFKTRYFRFAECVWYTFLHCGPARGMSVFLLLPRFMMCPIMLLFFLFLFLLSYRSEFIWLFFFFLYMLSCEKERIFKFMIFLLFVLLLICSEFTIRLKCGL